MLLIRGRAVRLRWKGDLVLEDEAAVKARGGVAVSDC